MSDSLKKSEVWHRKDFLYSKLFLLVAALGITISLSASSVLAWSNGHARQPPTGPRLSQSSALHFQPRPHQAGRSRLY